MTMTMTEPAGTLAANGPEPTNGGKAQVEFSLPYVVAIELTGTCDLLFHRWNCESVDAKSKAAKGSKAKKTDDTESYVWRDDDGQLSLPGEYVRQSIINAAKYRQDPRSPRKSAMDLFKAGVVSLTPLAKLGPSPARAWDYDHHARVQVQRNGVTRVRPAIRKGWTATLEMMVLLPEYIGTDAFQDVLVNAGRLIGVADYRPTYGRYSVTSFVVQNGDGRERG